MRSRKKQYGGNTAEAQWRLENYRCKELDFSYLNLTELPSPLPDDLKVLICTYNKLTSLPSLPNSLEILRCSNNKLTKLPILPNNLQKIWCDKNKLTKLPSVPNSLEHLFCDNNKLTILPNLPNRLDILECINNKLTTLPTLPDNLKKLNCAANNLTSLPTLPNSLENLDCSINKLITLPILPDSLINLTCYGNQLPEEYNIIQYEDENEDEDMRVYIERIRRLQDNNEVNFSNTKNINENTRNYISYENIANNDKMVNLPRSANKYNSDFKEYIKYNTWKNMLKKKPENPMTRYKYKKKNVKYYTAKLKKKNTNSKNA